MWFVWCSHGEAKSLHQRTGGDSVMVPTVGTSHHEVLPISFLWSPAAFSAIVQHRDLPDAYSSLNSLSTVVKWNMCAVLANTYISEQRICSAFYPCKTKAWSATSLAKRTSHQDGASTSYWHWSWAVQKRSGCMTSCRAERRARAGFSNGHIAGRRMRMGNAKYSSEPRAAGSSRAIATARVRNGRSPCSRGDGVSLGQQEESDVRCAVFDDEVYATPVQLLVLWMRGRPPPASCWKLERAALIAGVHPAHHGSRFHAGRTGAEKIAAVWCRLQGFQAGTCHALQTQTSLTHPLPLIVSRESIMMASMSMISIVSGSSCSVGSPSGSRAPPSSARLVCSRGCTLPAASPDRILAGDASRIRNACVPAPR